MRIAVLGPGGVGGFVAAAIERAEQDEAIVIAREETAELIRERGIVVRSRLQGDFTVQPQATPTLGEPVDVLIVATKATGLADGLARIATPPPLVVPLLNGLDHMATLRARFGDGTVVAGTIRIGSNRPEPGVIDQTSTFLRVDLGPGGEALAKLLERADIPARVLDSEARVLWDKFNRLCALALATSAYDSPIGPIRDDPEQHATLTAAVTELNALATAEGAPRPLDDVLAEIDAIDADLDSSMRRDILAHRPPELDEIGGAALRAGQRHGIPTPALQQLHDAVAARVAR